MYTEPYREPQNADPGRVTVPLEADEAISRQGIATLFADLGERSPYAARRFEF
jgi:hypothetical protein